MNILKNLQNEFDKIHKIIQNSGEDLNSPDNSKLMCAFFEELAETYFNNTVLSKIPKTECIAMIYYMFNLYLCDLHDADGIKELREGKINNVN